MKNANFMLIITIVFLVSVACGDNLAVDIDHPFVQEEIDIYPVWNEALNLIAYVHKIPGTANPDSAGIYVVKPDGTEKRFIYQGTSLAGLDWTKDGLCLITHTYFNLVKISFPDGIADTLISGGQSFYPVWSPDGRRIAFVKHWGNESGVHIVDSSGLGDRLVVHNGKYVNWPYQDSIVFLNLDTAFTIGSVYISDTGGVFRREVFSPYTTHNILYGNIKPNIHLTTKRIAFHAQEPGNPLSIWFYDPISSESRKIRESSAYPNFSPNGEEIIYTDTHEDNGRLCIMNWDGSGLRQLTY